MDRRDFLAGLGALGLASLPARGLAAAPFALHPELPPRLTPLRGYAGQDVACDALAIEGRIPASLRGTFYRNGPGLFERGGERYQHLFDGDGLVQAFRFTDGGVSHRARFVRTAKFKAESAAGRFLVTAFGTSIPARMPIAGPDALNTANTSVMLSGRRLMALWEGGSAHELDPETLETVGPVTWRPDLRQMPFSAHPKVEPDGTTWNFGAFGERVVLYQIAHDGTLVRAQTIAAKGAHLVHDFAVTHRHLVFLLAPIELDFAAFREGRSMVQSLKWHADRPTRVLTIDKADFTVRREYELPCFNFFHFGNAWEDAQGVIRADFVRTDDLALQNDWMPALMLGRDAPGPGAHPAQLVVNPRTNRASVEVRPETTEFPCVDPRVVGRRYRYVYCPARLRATANSGFDSVARIDLDTGQLVHHAYADGMMPEEHLVVPRAGSGREGDAWVLGAGFDRRRQQGFVSVFDGLDIAAGPVATAWLPYWTPPGFHGTFRAA